jgi:UDPglucose 6-dehydrogenase
MECYKLIIIKSTVPIGTCQRVKNKIHKTLIKLNKNIEFDIVSNPEFLREGTAISDFFKPDRIVIGTDNVKAESLMKSIYEDHIFKNTKFIYTNLETSEMIKYASNAFLATKVSFINEIANICELCGADINIVAKGMGLDKRIGDKFLNPGPGYGGSCFPKDINALIKFSEDLGYKPKIIERVRKTNLNQKKRAVKIINNFVGEIKNKTFTVLGLAFKPETDDIREAPSIYIIKALLKYGGKVKVFDPKAMNSLKKLYPKLEVQYCEDEYSACRDSDCIIVVTEWEQFKKLDFMNLKGIVNNPVFIDLKNMFDPKYVIDKGFLYKSIGRK